MLDSEPPRNTMSIDAVQEPQGWERHIMTADFHWPRRMRGEFNNAETAISLDSRVKEFRQVFIALITISDSMTMAPEWGKWRWCASSQGYTSRKDLNDWTSNCGEHNGIWDTAQQNSVLPGASSVLCELDRLDSCWFLAGKVKLRLWINDRKQGKSLCLTMVPRYDCLLTLKTELHWPRRFPLVVLLNWEFSARKDSYGPLAMVTVHVKWTTTSRVSGDLRTSILRCLSVMK
jgi:hypothetical protein